MWRRQRMMTGFRAGWRKAPASRPAIFAGTGLGIVTALVALAVTQAV